MRFGLLACTAGLAIGLGPSTARAQETTTYQYDSRGRLTAVSVGGVTNNGVATSYSLDPAGNRLGVTVTGASGSTPSSSVSANAENVTDATGLISTASQSMSWQMTPIPLAIIHCISSLHLKNQIQDY